MKAETKQINKILGFLGNDITHARTSLRTHNQACMRKQDYVYASPCPKKLKTQKIEQEHEEPNSNNLACLEARKNYILT